MITKVEKFLNKRKYTNQNIKLKGFILSLIYLVLFVTLFKNIDSNSGLILLSSIMVFTTLWICLSFLSINLLYRIEEKQRKKEKISFLNELVSYTKKNNSYEAINKLLQFKRSDLYIIELGYFLCLHHNGDWVDKSRITFPKAWGDNFLEKIKIFFKNQYIDINEISDLDVSTFLATVKKENMIQLIEGLNNA